MEQINQELLSVSRHKSIDDLLAEVIGQEKISELGKEMENRITILTDITYNSKFGMAAYFALVPRHINLFHYKTITDFRLSIRDEKTLLEGNNS